MEQLHDNFDTLVIVGSWNKYIFSEEWIVANILGEGVKYSIQYPLNALFIKIFFGKFYLLYLWRKIGVSAKQ